MKWARKNPSARLTIGRKFGTIKTVQNQPETGFRMTTVDQALYCMNIADGSSVKMVPCKRCGSMVGLVQSKKTGKWYTCQLQASMNPDSMAKRAYPFMPHYKYCRANNHNH